MCGPRADGSGFSLRKDVGDGSDSESSREPVGFPLRSCCTLQPQWKTGATWIGTAEAIRRSVSSKRPNFRLRPENQEAAILATRHVVVADTVNMKLTGETAQVSLLLLFNSVNQVVPVAEVDLKVGLLERFGETDEGMRCAPCSARFNRTT